MKLKNNIIILRAKGPIQNNYLKNMLSDLNYKILSFPILEIKSIYNKNINISKDALVFTTSYYGVYFLSKLCNKFDRNSLIMVDYIDHGFILQKYLKTIHFNSLQLILISVPMIKAMN